MSGRNDTRYRGPRDSLVQNAMARLRREGVPGPCSCGQNRDRSGNNTAKFEWDSTRAKFSPALCPECGKRLSMIAPSEATP